MAWSLWQPAKPTGLAATLQDGGSLAANTTYYLRVQALDSLSTSRVNPLYVWSGKHIYGPYSDVISVTTTSTQRSISLSWSPVYKRDGTTQVDAYEVLMTTDPTQFGVERAQIWVPSSNYERPTTHTNSYTITSTTLGQYHCIPDGVPYIEWDGNGTATPDSLYEWLRDQGYTQFVQLLTTPAGDTGRLAYRFVGFLRIMPYALGYAWRQEYQAVTIIGGVDFAGARVYIVNALLNVVHMSHAGGISYNWNAQGSTIRGCALWSAMVPTAVLLSTYPHRTWVRYAPGTLPTAPYEGWGANLQALNHNQSLDLYVPGQLQRPNTGGGIRSSTTWSAALGHLRDGQHIVSLEHVGNLGNPSYCFELVNNYQDWRFPHCTQIDCVTNASNYQSRTGLFIEPYAVFSSYGRDCGNRTSTLYKRLRVIALDEDGAPLPGARVWITGAGGQNLTMGNTTADITRLTTNWVTDGRNWQRSETTIKHDDEIVWLYDSTAYGTTPPEAGRVYWCYGERVRLVELIATDGGWRRWRLERGVDGTVAGWLVNTELGPFPLIRAPEYHTTDAAGEAWNITPLVVYKHRYDNPNWTGWLSNVPSTVGAITYYTPITVHVEADGYEPWQASYDIPQLQAVGVQPLVVVAQLQPLRQPIIVEQSQRISVTAQPVTISTRVHQVVISTEGS